VESLVEEALRIADEMGARSRSPGPAVTSTKGFDRPRGLVTEAGRIRTPCGEGATARPSADPWPTTEQPVYSPPVVYAVPGQRPPIVLVAAPPRRRGLTVFLIVAGVLAACCAGGATVALLSSAAIRDAMGIGTDSGGPANPASTTHPPTPTRGPAARPEHPVRDGKFQFVVSAVSCGHESVGQAPFVKRAEGQFCLVDLSVENVGNAGQLLLDGVQKAYDTAGSPYGSDSSAGVIANAGTSVWINVVNPGNTVLGTIVFDLPDGAQVGRLELHDSAFSRGVTVTIA
jgi:hypothetical protein